MISVTCPTCQTTIHLSEQLAGKTIRCKQCQQIFTVGELPRPPEPPPRSIKTVQPISTGPANRSDPYREGLQTRQGRVPPPVLKPADNPPPRRPAESPPPRRKAAPASPSKSTGLIIGGMVGGAVILVGMVIAGVLVFKNMGSSEKTAKLEESAVKVAWNAPRDTIRQETRSPVRQESPAPTARQESPGSGAQNDVPEKPPSNPEPRRDASDPPPAGDSSQAIPADLLDHLKSATVFVRVEGSQIKGSGSGFLIQVMEDGAFVITNAHVIDPKIEIEVKVSPRQTGPGMGTQGMPGMPRLGPNFGRPGFPRGPMGPIGPRGPMGPRLGPAQPSGEEETFKVVVPIGNATITSVFWSGTKKEQSYRAQVVASDRKRDLAILKLTGCKNLSNPIGIGRSVDLRETMPVYVLGFPFGKILPTNKGNPTITIGKGSVSSIRRDERDEVALVQIDGALNPGNSGGPVVDTQGRLVGVAVATINPELGSGIGFAIPTSKLTALLEGKQDNRDNPQPPNRKPQS